MIRTGLRKFVTKFDDELKFFKNLVNHPRTTGAIIPTSNITAERMASIIDCTSDLPVLEIGPGTGVITRAILARGVKPAHLYAIEHSHEFSVHLQHHYPEINVIEGDVFDLKNTFKAIHTLVFDSVISSIPLLNFPMDTRVQYIENMLERIPYGRPLLQLTYSPRPPVPLGQGNYTIKRFHFIMRNIPPAHLWVYKKGKRS